MEYDLFVIGCIAKSNMDNIFDGNIENSTTVNEEYKQIILCKNSGKVYFISCNAYKEMVRNADEKDMGLNKCSKITVKRGNSTFKINCTEDIFLMATILDGCMEESGADGIVSKINAVLKNYEHECIAENFDDLINFENLKHTDKIRVIRTNKGEKIAIPPKSRIRAFHVPKRYSQCDVYGEVRTLRIPKKLSILTVFDSAKIGNILFDDVNVIPSIMAKRSSIENINVSLDFDKIHRLYKNKIIKLETKVLKLPQIIKLDKCSLSGCHIERLELGKILLYIQNGAFDGITGLKEIVIKSCDFSFKGDIFGWLQ